MLHSKRKRKEAFDMLLYTIPAILLVTVMMYIPFVMSGYYSLTRWNGIAKNAEFIGLENFKTIFASGGEFTSSLLFTLKYTLVFIIFSNVAALFLAVCLTKKFKLANLMQDYIAGTTDKDATCAAIEENWAAIDGAAE